MEKIDFQNSKGLNLTGILHLPRKRTEYAIAVSHGFTATKDRPRLIKLSESLSEAGFAVLRFDFGGCGESESRDITIKHQVDDLKSSINYLRKAGYTEIGLWGESLGGLISIRAYDKQIKTIVLHAPVTKARTPGAFKGEEYLKELEEKGYVIYKKDGREFNIPKEYSIELRSIDQKNILSKIECPVLIISGDKDDAVPLEQSKEAMQYLPKESKLEIIKDGQHHLNEKEWDTVISLSVDWFKEYLIKYLGP